MQPWLVMAGADMGLALQPQRGVKKHLCALSGEERPVPSISETIAVRRVAMADAGLLLPVNNASARETSEMTAQEFGSLIGQAFYAAQVGDGEAFIVVLDETADYASPNFLWFKARFPRFAYVDRVVTAAHARRRGYARALYEGAILEAKATGHSLLGCEVNIDPPNPNSEAFHETLGFSPIGTAQIGPGKAVRYFARKVVP